MTHTFTHHSDNHSSGPPTPASASRAPAAPCPLVSPLVPERRSLQYGFRRLLIAVLCLSAGLSIAYALGAGIDLWILYSRIYLFLLLAYTWFIFILMFLDDARCPSYPRYQGEKIAVLVPCFNEAPELLERSISSVLNARGRKHICVIDDGSKTNIRPLLERLSEEGKIHVHFFPQNRGKREALTYAVKHMLGDAQFVVTIDSDTVLDRDALIRVVEPLKQPRIGASTGDVRLLNEKQNWLTRMIASYYWIGLNIYKKAQSSLGMVVCCSGCLAGYKRSILEANINRFSSQTFLGQKCTHSEDRHLTNLVLQRGYNVVYIPAAISYTETPATVRGFLRQQQRWKRGYTRESLYTLSYAWRSRPILFLQILLWDLSIPFFSFGLMLALAATLVTRPIVFFTVMVPSWALCMLVRNIPIIFYGRGKIGGLFLYMFFYECCLYWQSVYALFTVQDKRWMTR